MLLHKQCSMSTFIDEETLTFGHGNLDEHGVWEYGCAQCAEEYLSKHPDAKVFPRLRRVHIVDLKVKRRNGVLYCRLIDAETSESIISADLNYIVKAIRERGYELMDAFDVLHKVGVNFAFYPKGGEGV